MSGANERLADATVGLSNIARGSVQVWRVLHATLDLQARHGHRLHVDDIQQLSELIEQFNLKMAPCDAYGAALVEQQFLAVLMELARGVTSPAL